MCNSSRRPPDAAVRSSKVGWRIGSAPNTLLPQLTGLGLAAGLSPIPIVGVVLLLSTPRARANSLWFAATWTAAIFVFGSVAALLASRLGHAYDDLDSGAATWKIVAGVLFVLLGLRYWRGRPRGDEVAEVPKWMEGVDRFNAGRSSLLALTLSVLNPKNLLLVLGAAAAVAGSDAGPGEQALMLGYFTLLATLGVAAPIAIHLLMRERSALLLERLRQWMVQRNAVIMTALCVVLGAYLVVSS